MHEEIAVDGDVNIAVRVSGLGDVEGMSLSELESALFERAFQESSGLANSFLKCIPKAVLHHHHVVHDGAGA